MNKTKALEWFEYRDGDLYWRKSPNKKVKEGSLVKINPKNEYTQVTLHGEKWSVHRLIYLIHYGEFYGNLDHIDGNSRNNKIGNLRMASYSENNINRKTPKSNTSGFKGVYFCKQTSKWRSSISSNGNRLRLGRFDNLEDAVNAYEKAAEKVHGNFRRTV